MRFAIALLVTLLSQPTWARADEQQQPSDRRPAAPQAEKDIPGYGYGTQHGQEANGGAKQSTRKAAKKSTAPQDERGAAASRAAEQEGSATVPHSGSASGSRPGKSAHAKPARAGRTRAKPETERTRAGGASDAAKTDASSATATTPQR